MEGEEEKGKSQKEGKDMIQLDDETKFYNYIEKYLASNSEAKVNEIKGIFKYLYIYIYIFISVRNLQILGKDLTITT